MVMKKAGADPKVKKTFVRHSEQNVRNNHKVVHDVAGSSKSSAVNFIKPTDQELDKPTLCSSEVLANYLTDAKHAIPRAHKLDDLNIDKAQISTKVTKKLNFHFNDRIYKNLVELNADIASSKNKKGKKVRTNLVKKDLEPNIEDFCQEEKEEDECPHIPVIKPKVKPVKRIESSSLHKLVSSFEVL
ncbi:uncharacterized protein LOC119840002 [Zerene cesonia]|uniref:uncharacterized protein LOC119840002 n=1 Tax=Zerene cesonia TaxID=33412 RepID=UPI0018E52D7F|nr:uncharacterized protein LOC119840002 [Zerene cesonia]